MVHKTTYTMKLRRRREGKTDYRKRLALLKSGKDRLVARVKGRQVIAQVTAYNEKGDKILATATSTELAKYGYKGHAANVKASYLTGLLCGTRAKNNGVTQAVLDIGLHTPVNGSNVFAVLKGAVDAGLDVAHSEDCFPKEERLEGTSDAAEKIKKELKK